MPKIKRRDKRTGLTTKEWCVFGILKILEVAAFIFVPFWAGRFTETVLGLPSATVFIVWLLGTAFIVVTVSIPFFLWGILSHVLPDFIAWNKKLTKKIMR